VRIVVAGASISGLAATLGLARAGHQVSLIERDSLGISDDPESALQWPRNGIAHFHQPHAFLPRGRLLLLRHFPDVYQALLNAGALEYDCARIVPGSRQAEDSELVALAVRRPLIEWALRDAVLREPAVQLLPEARVTGLVGRSGAVPRIEGVRLRSGEEVRGDLVVDALGRTSPALEWIQQLGSLAPHEESSSCGLLYFSRYFRLRPGSLFPAGPWLTCFGPRIDLGYAMFSTFVGDNRTFAIVWGVPTWDADLHILRHERAFMTACSQSPVLRQWTEVADPITPVMPMGALQNTMRDYQVNGSPCATGLLPFSDAFCHTDPAFGLGLSFAMIHAAALVHTLEEIPAGAEAQTRSYFARIEPEARERFVMCRDLDNARNEVWKGVKLDFSKRTGCYPLFVAAAAGVVATRDPEVCRKWLRRITFLDRAAVIDDDVELQQRVEIQFAEIRKAAPPPQLGPDRGTLLSCLQAAAASGAAS
jgi:2-polyprenyl-6-methoxyphenol hydroxylase-like FAD-dependent oxidoreductase